MSESTQGGYFYEDLAVGMQESYVRRVGENDLLAFAHLTGDTNPIHLDQDFAAKTRFKQRIAHGALTVSYISTVLGTKLPGAGAIYVSQSVNFRAPVRIGDEVTATVRVTELLPTKKRVLFTCHCLVDGKTVLDAEAILMVPARPE